MTPTPSGSKFSHWLSVANWLPIAAVGFYTLFLAVGGFFIATPYKIPTMILIAVLAFCHMVIGSIKIIREQELAVLIFFGVILKQWKSGPHYALAPFFYVRRETKNSIQVDFGTLDEKKVQEIERARRAEQSQSWYVMTEPVRINWGDMRSLARDEVEQERYANDPYAHTMTTDPHFYFRVKIVNLQELIEEVGGLKEALERIRVTCIRALSEEAGKTFVAKARQELSVLNKMIMERVEDLVGDPNARARAMADGKAMPRSWGLDVEEAAIQDIGAPHAANTALAERTATIAQADGLATAKVRTAIAERRKLVEEGAGRAEVVERTAEAERRRLELEGIGRAAAIKATAEAVTLPGGELLLRTDTLKSVMTASGGKIVVVPADLSSLTGTLVGAVEAIKSLGDTKPEQLPKTSPPDSKQ